MDKMSGYGLRTKPTINKLFTMCYSIYILTIIMLIFHSKYVKLQEMIHILYIYQSIMHRCVCMYTCTDIHVNKHSPYSCDTIYMVYIDAIKTYCYIVRLFINYACNVVQTSTLNRTILISNHVHHLRLPIVVIFTLNYVIHTYSYIDSLLFILNQVYGNLYHVTCRLLIVEICMSLNHAILILYHAIHTYLLNQAILILNQAIHTYSYMDTICHVKVAIHTYCYIDTFYMDTICHVKVAMHTYCYIDTFYMDTICQFKVAIHTNCYIDTYCNVAISILIIFINL